MAYVYSIMWLGIAIFLFVMGIKEYKILAIFSIYFLTDAVWWFLNAFTETNMFGGVLGWVFRGITLVFIIVGFCYYFLFWRKKKSEKNRSDK